MRRIVLGLAILGVGIAAFAAGVTGSGADATKVLGLGVLAAAFGMCPTYQAPGATCSGGLLAPLRLCSARIAFALRPVRRLA